MITVALEAPGRRVFYVDACGLRSIRECWPLLSSNEQERVLRAPARARRMAFIAGRAALRVVVSDLIGVPPTSIPIMTSARGRPFMGDAAAGISFNVSYAADIIAIAVSDSGDVGIDVELGSRLVPAEVVNAVCCLPEREALSELDSWRERGEALVRLWTGKESILKATGEGLQRPPGSVCLTPLVYTSSATWGPFAVSSFQLADSYRAALAYRFSKHSGGFGLEDATELDLAFRSLR